VPGQERRAQDDVNMRIPLKLLRPYVESLVQDSLDLIEGHERRQPGASQIVQSNTAQDWRLQSVLAGREQAMRQSALRDRL
jgi:hypothetical protein